MGISGNHFILSHSTKKKITMFLTFSFYCHSLQESSRIYLSMMPGIDLILVALLHGSFISFVVALATCVAFICLFVAFCIVLLLVVFVDLYDVFSLVSCYLVVVRSNVELAFVLSLVVLIRFIIGTSLALRSIVQMQMKMKMIKVKM